MNTTPVWTLEFQRHGIFGPCRWRWTLCRNGVVEKQWFGMSKFTCQLWARYYKRTHAARKNREQIVITETL